VDGREEGKGKRRPLLLSPASLENRRNRKRDSKETERRRRCKKKEKEKKKKKRASLCCFLLNHHRAAVLSQKQGREGGENRLSIFFAQRLQRNTHGSEGRGREREKGEKGSFRFLLFVAPLRCTTGGRDGREGKVSSYARTFASLAKRKKKGKGKKDHMLIVGHQDGTGHRRKRRKGALVSVRGFDVKRKKRGGRKDFGASSLSISSKISPRPYKNKNPLPFFFLRSMAVREQGGRERKQNFSSPPHSLQSRLRRRGEKKSGLLLLLISTFTCSIW